MPDKDDKVGVKIRGLGLGILEEEFTMVWERYFRTKSIEEKKNGSGFDLSIAKRIPDLTKYSLVPIVCKVKALSSNSICKIENLEINNSLRFLTHSYHNFSIL